MKARVLVAVILIPILLVLALAAPVWLLTAVLALVSALMAFEFMRGAGLSAHTRSTAYATVFAAAVPVWAYLGAKANVLYALVFALTLLVFYEAVISYKGEGAVVFRVLGTIFAAALIPLLFVSVLRIRLMQNGEYLVMLPFVAAYCSDTGAFFTGRALGKKKLIPHVSPNKTVAGAWGGLGGAVLGMAVYGLIIRFAFMMPVNFPLLVVYGLIGGAAGQLGDLAFSLMKREFKIKDYGNLLPGHGGILDRGDSVVFTAPLMYCLILWLPAIGA